MPRVPGHQFSPSGLADDVWWQCGIRGDRGRAEEDMLAGGDWGMEEIAGERDEDLVPVVGPVPSLAVVSSQALREVEEAAVPGPSRQEEWRNVAPVADQTGIRERAVDDRTAVLAADPPGAGSKDMEVWIIGHSFIHWAHRHACGRPYGSHLDLHNRGVGVRWLGRRGMLWDELLPYVQKICKRLCAPRVLVIHLGGNDWGRMVGRHFINIVRKDLMAVSILMPTTILCWSDIIVRPALVDNVMWRRSRSKANQQIGSWLERLGGRHIRHEWSWGKLGGLFRNDGIHLSFLGTDLFLNDIQEVLEALFPK
ncbi:uncharacterized protein LOC115090367 [Rhinatrema bivittatum]|uniref:uncharacterized protein LOC115090367 n=1 Tax=Rhinatrema bivittatum TaxID=194408 RepID=UPI001128EF06|nr:uncharacterized protein LOC115090367 [Rhinatrema bivittatum]